MIHGWFTIVAQAINFLILVWLLKRFLYKPILNAIDEREQGIANQLAGAEAKVADATRARDDFRHKNEIFDQQRDAMVLKATDDAKTAGQKLLDQARKDSDALRDKRHAALQAEQRLLNQDIRRWTETQVFAIARKTLADLASTSLEARMSEVFVARLRALTGSAKEQLAAAFKKSPPTALVRSSFDLPSAQRTEIEAAIKETFDPEIQVKFQTAPELVSGVELSSNGQKVAWSIEDYLSTLQESVAELVPAEVKPEFGLEIKSKPDARPPTRAGLEPATLAAKGHR
jgi:F-type H+-transporting ATPase subunit b